MSTEDHTYVIMTTGIVNSDSFVRPFLNLES